VYDIARRNSWLKSSSYCCYFDGFDRIISSWSQIRTCLLTKDLRPRFLCFDSFCFWEVNGNCVVPVVVTEQPVAVGNSCTVHLTESYPYLQGPFEKFMDWWQCTTVMPSWVWVAVILKEPFLGWQSN
jgi:hypothetical protein